MCDDARKEAERLRIERCERGNKAMRAFAAAMCTYTVPEDQLSDFLIDLLADLRHWAKANEVDFTTIDAEAQGHFEAEVAEGAEPCATKSK